ncbi:MAG: BMP family ABC transporter substrate-binding protein [Syntrophomonas sp.]|nr:BMP family ABC transporter substrate-binding protein [Syntrophomonas sp.]
MRQYVKRVVLLFLGLSLVTFGIGCRDIGSMVSSRPDKRMKVALVFDSGGRGDGSFNDMAYAGLEQAQQKYGDKIMIDYYEPSAGGDNREMLLRLASESKCDLVIGVGFTFSDCIPKVACEFPSVKYSVIDASIPGLNPESNVTCLLFREQEGSFLMGAAAALSSHTGKIGFVGGMICPLIEKFEAGYLAGARYVNPSITVMTDYIGTDLSAFANLDKGQSLATRQYQSGCDIIYHASGASGLGVMHAAALQNKLVIGVDADQSLTALPEEHPFIFTSMVKRVDTAVFSTIQQSFEGKLKGGYMEFGLIEGGVGYAQNQYNQNNISGIIPQLEKIKAEIISGQIQVPEKRG